MLRYQEDLIELHSSDKPNFEIAFHTVEHQMGSDELEFGMNLT